MDMQFTRLTSGVRPFAPRATSAADLLERLATSEFLASRDQEGLTPLMRAVRDNDPDLVTFLAPRSDLLAIAKHGDYSFTALRLAAGKGHVECMRALLAHQPREQAHHAPPKTEHAEPIYTAIFKDHPDCVELLAPHTDLDALTSFAPANEPKSHTPLTFATQFGRLECLRRLLPHCDAKLLNTRNFDGLTALDLAVAKHDNDSARLLLAQPGIDRDGHGRSGRAQDDDGAFFASSFLLAIEKDNVEMLGEMAPRWDLNARFVPTGANLSNQARVRPLMQAVLSQSPRCVEFLAARADLSALMLPYEAPQNLEHHWCTPFEMALDRARDPENKSNCGWAIVDIVAARMAAVGRFTDMAHIPETIQASASGVCVEMPRTLAALEARALQGIVDAGKEHPGSPPQNSTVLEPKSRRL